MEGIEFWTSILSTQALPAGLIVAFVVFSVVELWPFVKEQITKNRDREHELDLARVEAQKDSAKALIMFAASTDNFTRVIETYLVNAQAD